MCGLVSVITKARNGFSADHRDAFDLLLFLDTIRGDDSTGAFVVNNIGNLALAKEATFAPNFMRSKEYLDLRTRMFKDGWAAVGHNRAATRGEVTDENAHPFVVDNNIVLVHNGSYNGDHRKLKDVDVDSLAIAHTISETDTVENALRKVDSAYALIWYNQEQKSLNFIRNNQRPLFMMELDMAWMFASEAPFLQLVKSKFRLMGNKDIEDLKEHEHHKFTLGEHGATTHERFQLDCSFHKYNPPETSAIKIYDEGWWDKRYNRHHHACGWEDYDGDTVPNATPTNPNIITLPDRSSGSPRTEEAGKAAINQITKQVVRELDNHDPIDTRHTKIMNKLMESIYEDCKTVTFADYGKLKEEIPDGTKIKVLINDIISADGDPRGTDYLLLGTTFSNHKVYATFPMKEENFDKCLAGATNDAVFEIEVGGISWKCTESLSVRTKQSKKMPDWHGVVIVHGRKPQALYVPGAQGHA